MHWEEDENKDPKQKSKIYSSSQDWPVLWIKHGVMRVWEVALG